MLIQTTNIHSEGTLTSLGETRRFGMQANAKAFRILIDGLYSDKIKAPIRELTTNAYDSHVMAGCPEKPFDVSLPTLLESTFTVRDYGTGMTHSEVMNLYTEMFGSSKDDNNTQVGGFGIGSKSPFAYTDTFSVTCFDGVERRDYFAHLAEDGVPCLTHLETSPSDEQRGTLVSMPVKNADHNPFIDRWLALRRGFDVQPTLNIDLPDTEPWVWTGPGWRARPGSSSGNYLGIRMGCVVYPTDRFAYPDYLQIEVDAPVGAYGVTATREALEWTPESTGRCRGLLVWAEDQVRIRLAWHVDQAKTWREARTLSNQMERMCKSRTGDLTWHGRPLHDTVTSPVALTRGDGLQRTQFTIDLLDKMILLVQRPDQRIPRQVIRLAAYRRGRQHSVWTMTGNPKDVIKRLGLRPDQVVPLATIPDVIRAKTVRGKATNVAGVYDSQGRPVTELFLDGSEWYVLKESRHATSVDVLEKLMGAPVFQVTPSSQARLVKLGVTRLQGADKVCAAEQRRDEATTWMNNSGLTYYGPLVRQHLGVSLVQAKHDSVLSMICHTLSIPTFTETLEKYPLLSHTIRARELDRQLSEYMQAVDDGIL